MRTKDIRVRVTADEFRTLTNKANGLSLEVSTYIRMIALNAEIEATAYKTPTKRLR